MEIISFVKKDVRHFVVIFTILVLVLVAFFMFDVKMGIIDNYAEKLYNILIG